MPEFIVLRKPMAAVDYVSRLQSLHASVHLCADICQFPVLNGVVNGRHAVLQTMCFVDREPSAAAQAALVGAIVLTTAEWAPTLINAHVIISDDPRALFIDFVNGLLADNALQPMTSLISETPTIHPQAVIDASARIESGVYIGKGASIAAGCVIKTGTWIGENVIVRENTVIGCNGISLYKTRDGRVLRFPHVAGIHIGAGTEIGAGCVLPRGMMSSSRIGRDCVIGNLCNIGHGVILGEKVWMSVGTLIGGNSHIGDDCTLGMGCSIRDNISLQAGVTVGMGSVVVKDIEAGASVFGNPAKRLPNIDAGPQR